MTCKDFSNNFDILLASYRFPIASGDTSSLQDIVLDEYEKSLFLTRAQEVLVTTYYSGASGAPFEVTEELRRYLDTLVKPFSCTKVTTTPTVDFTYGSFKHTIFNLPTDLWYIVYEQAVYSATSGCYKNRTARVTAMTHNELDSVIENPFRGPSLKRVIRVDKGGNLVELISKEDLSTYKIRYVSKPTPIVLMDLDPENAIDGVYQETECKLHSSLHRVILEMAVQLAITSITKGGKTE